jgi:serine/threonine protein kinase/tetratricopeptide (TPR) repeat protein
MTESAPAPPLAGEPRRPDEWKGTSRYEVLRRIGEGGMGVVYEVYDRECDRHLALKTLPRFSPDQLYRFKQEFRMLADVRHSNLVRLHELVVTDAEHAFFVMELVRGTDFLEHVVRAGSRASQKPAAVRRDEPTKALRGAPEAPRSSTMLAAATRRAATAADIDRLRLALRQLVDGLRAVHQAGKLHRDIKPSNVLVTPYGRVVILDFGVATELSHLRDQGPDEQEIVGTARYMAPEQALGEALSPASDWYSVGVVLYVALVGRPPFVGSPREVIGMKTLSAPKPPSEHVDGVPPDLDGLCLALLHPDPSMRPNASEIRRRLGASVSLRPQRSPLPIRDRTAGALIGRHDPLQALRDAFANVLLGRSITVRVGGRSGTGKSALVGHFLDQLEEAREALVLRGRAYERETIPYKAFDAVVDTLSRHLMRLEDAGEPIALPDDVAALARIFPVLRRVRSIGMVAEEAATDPRRVRQQAFAALRHLLRSVAQRQPLVLYVDDVHWGDADSAALFLELMRPPDAPPLLVVMTYRDNETKTSPFLAEVSARWPESAEMRDLMLGPLGGEDARQLALTLLGSRQDDPLVQRTAIAVARESRGSPFLLEELARSVGARFGAGDASGATLSSLTLEQMVSERLAALPDAARRLVEILAVAGRPLHVTIARDASGSSEATDDIVSLLDARRFVHAGLRDGREVVEMIHDRIRETIASLLKPEAIRVHHARLAQVIEATPDADPEALTAHLIGAGEHERAAHYAERAAERAASKLAFDQAARLLRLTLETVPSSSPNARRLRFRLGEVLEWAAQGAEAARVYLEAADGAPTLQRAELERAAAGQLLTCGRIDEGAAVLRRVLATTGVRMPRSSLSLVFWLIFYRVWVKVVGLRFKEREAEELSRIERLRLDALYTATLGFSLVNVVLGACVQERYMVEALRAGERAHVLRAALMLTTGHANMGGPQGTRERALKELTVRLVAKSDSLEDHSFFHGIRGVALFLRGRWKEALEVLDMAYAKYPNNRAGWQSNANLFGVHALLFIGDVAELKSRHMRLLREADQRGDRYTAVNLRLSPLKIVALAADEPEQARRNVRDAMAEWSQRDYLLQHWQALRVEVDIDLYVGETASASARVVRALPALRKSFLLKGQYIRAVTADMRGRCAVASSLSAPRESTARLAEAGRMARQLERERMPHAALWAVILRAGVASVQGKTDRAAECLRTAIELAGQLDMSLYALAARYQLGTLVGGEGREIAVEADEAMRAAGVVAPKRFAPVLVPGRWETT